VKSCCLGGLPRVRRLQARRSQPDAHGGVHVSGPLDRVALPPPMRSATARGGYTVSHRHGGGRQGHRAGLQHNAGRTVRSRCSPTSAHAGASSRCARATSPTYTSTQPRPRRAPNVCASRRSYPPRLAEARIAVIEPLVYDALRDGVRQETRPKPGLSRGRAGCSTARWSVPRCASRGVCPVAWTRRERR
jgi:hypothetical protein